MRGDIYETLGVGLNFFGTRKEAYTRSHVKKLWPKAIYGGPARLLKSRVGKVLAEFYPGFLAAVRRYIVDKERPTWPARCSESESAVMIGRVAQAIVDSHPHAPIATVHDAVITSASYADDVAKAIADGWRDQIGVTPRITRTTLTR